MINAFLSFLWDKTPVWVRLPVIMLGAPAGLVALYLTWHTNDIHATIRPYKEKRDAEIHGIMKLQKSMDRKLDILILRK